MRQHLLPNVPTLARALFGMIEISTIATAWTEGVSSSWPVAETWVPFVLLLLLGGLAAWDAFTGCMPDEAVFLLLLISVGAHGFVLGWSDARVRLIEGLATMMVLWGVNHLYYRRFHCDAFGLGDSKWSGLAAITFGIAPVAVAWVIGAWLGCLWIAFGTAVRWVHARLTQSAQDVRIRYVHFGPFLFLGLLGGLCLRARGLL